MLKTVNIITLVILIVGGINWGLIGLFDFNMLTVMYGPAEDEPSPGLVARIAYVVIALCAIWQAILLLRRLTPTGEPRSRS